MATRTFAGQPGYDTPKVFDSGPALGELEPIRQAGYARLAGLVGFGPVFHTRLDRATPTTTPDILEPVARGVLAFVGASISRAPHRIGAWPRSAAARRS